VSSWSRDTALVLEALSSVLGEGKPADRVLDRLLRAHRELSSAERGRVARRVLGISCLRGRLDYLLSGMPGFALTPDLWRIALYSVTEEAESVDQSCAELGLEPKALEALLAKAPEWPSEPAARLAAERSLPAWLARLLCEQRGYDFSDALAQSLNRPGPVFARANRLRIDRDELAAVLRREGIESVPTRFSPDGLILQGRPNIFGSAAWRAGLFEMQDEGSQLIATLCAAAPGEHCVDFCAGAGGKTLALAADMANQGRLVALDVNPQRVADMRPRLVRAGVSVVEPLVISPEGPLPESSRGASLVLVDAPCSSLGTLRRGPDARWRLDPAAVAAFPALQLSILERACTCLGPGGRLVYATCTLNRAENEGIADRFGARHPELTPVPVSALLPAPLAGQLEARSTLVLWPHLHGTDGVFACVWQRAR